MKQVFNSLGIWDPLVISAIVLSAVGAVCLLALVPVRSQWAWTAFRYASRAILIVWPVAVVVLTLTSAPAFDPGLVLIPFRDLASMSGTVLLTNVVGNVLLFAVPSAALKIVAPRFWSFGRTVACAVVVSLSIETIQLFTSRNVSIDDVILNVCGAMFGFSAACLLISASAQRLAALAIHRIGSRAGSRD